MGPKYVSGVCVLQRQRRGGMGGREGGGWGCRRRRPRSGRTVQKRWRVGRSVGCGRCGARAHHSRRGARAGARRDFFHAARCQARAPIKRRTPDRPLALEPPPSLPLRLSRAGHRPDLPDALAATRKSRGGEAGGHGCTASTYCWGSGTVRYGIRTMGGVYGGVYGNSIVHSAAHPCISGITRCQTSSI
eukprot:349942-Chlamydomonas_euryale.AAC.1